MKNIENINETEQIKENSNYCLNCKTKPCYNACPLGNNIPEFIKYIKEENFEEAYKTLSLTTVLQSICGRICPHMSQCMGSCVRGIKSSSVNIGKLEAFVGDLAIKNNYEMANLKEQNINEIKDKEESNQNNIKLSNIISNTEKVAIIGGGPAGLTCAAFLARKGFEVTIYEKHKQLGGLLRHGIPDFRLDKNILNNVINNILNLGINVRYNTELGVNIKLEDLVKEYNYIFISIGANIPWTMGIEGENLNGVFGGNSLLEHANHPNYIGKNVAIIGGGNLAMDCARTIKRMGAQKVSIIYRRAEEQMPAEKKEIEDAKKEGIEFLFQTNIIKILGENKVEKIECIKTQLIQKEGDTRLSPVDIENSNFELDMDYVVMAIGSTVDEKVVNSLGLECDRKGYIKVNENYETSMKNVYAGGDLIGGKATVAWAARSGRNVAEIISNCKKDL